LGPRKAGKTAIVNEVVWRMESEKRTRAKSERDQTHEPANEEIVPRTVWHVSPMRLISGMSYLGQWENRVLAILDHAVSQDLVLYLDDFLGLHSAGVSAQSDLHVAAVLKPFLERKNSASSLR
jgi:ATP-dependent Clp protease ATP-binding subunit ClpA